MIMMTVMTMEVLMMMSILANECSPLHIIHRLQLQQNIYFTSAAQNRVLFSTTTNAHLGVML